jgi:hypothetical protein
LTKAYRLKDGYAPPKSYLGVTINHWRLHGKENARHWGHSSDDYVREAIKTINMVLASEGK